MQIKLNDNAPIDVIGVNGKSSYFQGANRDAFEIQFAKNTMTFSQLDNLTVNGAKKIILIDGDKQFVHDNYCLRAGLALKPFVIIAATSTTPEVTEDRLCVTLAQMTYLEVQQAQSDDAIAELSVLVAGGVK